jgi:hypothetical protein
MVITCALINSGTVGFDFFGGLFIQTFRGFVIVVRQ